MIGTTSPAISYQIRYTFVYIYTSYVDSVEMLLHINRKVHIGKIEIICFAVKFHFNRPSLLISGST